MQDTVVISNLVANEHYCRAVLPYLKEEYFSTLADKAIYGQVLSHFTKYNTLPTHQAILIDIDEASKLSEDEFKSIEDRLKNLDKENPDFNWLLDTTEKFCKERALFNALKESLAIVDGKSKHSKAMMPEILTQALAISFDPYIGHDYFDDSDDRFNYYHKKEAKIPFDIELLNRITKGGVSRKTLNILLAGTGVGKTLVMCHMAARNLQDGHNVLYITNEMAEERIAERIDANLLDLTLEELNEVVHSTYSKRMDKLKSKSQGRLIIKEYPTATASVLQFKHLLSELKIKRNFVPDIIYIDYLNICASARIKAGANVNSYTYIKAIAEELRGLAVEYNVPIISATQTTRSGFANSDIELTDTSESFGLPMTADFMIALISTEELDKISQLCFKQLKNRYSDMRRDKRFVVGLDRSKMRLYNLDDSAQENLMDDSPVMDNTTFGDRFEQESRTSDRRSPRRSGGNLKTFPG